ncbi:MAG TPA: DUF72 domain-containing protein [Bacteroidetes bacterium]|nr:DUF72 domain-containing protein [Bacteroidota bacterium]
MHPPGMYPGFPVYLIMRRQENHSNTMKCYIGCSGFYYSDWKGKFYPENLPRTKWLEYYADHFPAVEINNTFYNMPGEKELAAWKDRTPPHFRFAVKAHRFFTHMKKLKTDGPFRQRLGEFLHSLDALDDKLACVLWQLPANLHGNLLKLENFAGMLDKNYVHVLEFRHPSWFNPHVYDLMRDAGLAFCMLSAPGDLPEEVQVTAPLAYVRFHGKNRWYDHFYGEDELENWKEKLKRMEKEHHPETLYAFFNNDMHAHAAKNARTLASLLNK